MAMSSSLRPTDDRVLLGVDAGTGGVRVLAVDVRGQVLAQAAEALAPEALLRDADRHEQQPEAWWRSACHAAHAVMSRLAAARVRSERLAGLAVDGTSGTLVALDARGRPLRAALMYNDPRGADQAQWLNARGAEFCAKLGYRFASSYALAKIAWLRAAEPEVFARAARLVHQADYLVERLAGRPCATDSSNALKTGYDLVDERWPEWIDEAGPLLDRLPAVVSPGTPVAQVSRQASEATGLPAGLTIVAGATDGTAAFLASGAWRARDYNTTLGTTLVFKGVSDHLCRHAQGLVYCHKLPGGSWLPGAASNTGCEWIERWFAGQAPGALDRAAAAALPCPVVAYPLARTGERFPFAAPEAAGFFFPAAEDDTRRYAACLQGTALVERLGYEVLDQVASTAGGEVFSTGGGSRSDVWTQCRADVTGRVMHRPACPESAFGSAVLAAAGTTYNGWAEAVRAMVRRERSFWPSAERADGYEAIYRRFRDELSKRGYV